MTKTTVIKQSDLNKNWYLVDAKGVRLGRLATQCAALLIGKGKPERAHNMVSGDAIVIINAREIDVYKNKLQKKKYYSHSTYRGGFKETTLEEMLEKFPERVIEKAISGMLPKTKLREQFMNNLYVYAGSEHKHESQKPVKIEIK
jgi:large subunit ribosomal protein L13